MKFNCKDCDFKSDIASEFVDHVRVCPKNPIPVPSAILEREADQVREAAENS